MEFVYSIISFLTRVIPTKNIMVFCSNPDYADNSFAFCRYLAMKGYSRTYKFYWLIDEKERKMSIAESLVKDGIETSVVYRKSLWGFWLFLRSRYIFSTHGLFDKIRLYQHKDKHVCFWHGMPLKKIGAMVPGQAPCAPNANITIATSAVFKEAMAVAFALPSEKVLLTGQPRCDMLIEESDWFKNNGIDKSNYRKIGIWMPTFRKSIRGSIRTDGEYRKKTIGILNEEQLSDFDKFLNSKNILMIVKIHPMDALQTEQFPPYKNIRIIYPSDNSYKLYPLLGSADFLLTDYSSVYIDYEILGRPIGFVMNDIQSYKGNRGLYFNDLETSLPGPIIPDFDSLCAFVNEPFSKKCDVVYNDFKDIHACERIENILFVNNK